MIESDDGRAMADLPVGTKRTGLICTAVAALVAAGISLWGWLRLPGGTGLSVLGDTLGRADNFGSKAAALILMPLLILALGVMFSVLARLLPGAPDDDRDPHLPDRLDRRRPLPADRACLDGH